MGVPSWAEVCYPRRSKQGLRKERAMKVGQDKVVTIRYTLQVEGEVLDQGELSYLHGHRNLIPGLEEALEAFRGLSGASGGAPYM